MANVSGDLAVKNKMDVTDNAHFHKGLQSPYLEMVDSKDSGTAGGDFNADTNFFAGWKTRDLTSVLFNDFATTITDVAGVIDIEASPGSLSPGDGARFTLPAGIYFIEAEAPALDVGEHVARLADVTDQAGGSAATVVLGTSEYCGSAITGDSVQTKSKIVGKFQLSRSTTLEIQHRCAVTRATDGFGSDGAFYETANVFTTVRMWQVRADY